MIELLTIFIAQFLTIFLLGNQSLMVKDHNYVGAAIGSMLIGLAQFYIYQVVQDIDMYTVEWYTFLVAGPMAIVTAIKFHPTITKLISRRKVEDTRSY